MTPSEQQRFVAAEREADTAPGRRLREAREAANLSLAEVASQLHLERRAVEFLERDEYDKLHAPTFVRGYLSSYARLLQLPERPILEAYDRRGFGPPALVPDIAQKPQVQVSDLPVRMVTYLIAAMLVLLVILWWQSRQAPLEEERLASEAAGEASSPPPAATELAAAPPPEQAPEPARPTAAPVPVDGAETMDPGQASASARREPPLERPAFEGGSRAETPSAAPAPNETGDTLASQPENASVASTPGAGAGDVPAPAEPADLSTPPSAPPAPAVTRTSPGEASEPVADAPPGEPARPPAGEEERPTSGGARTVAAAPAPAAEEPAPEASSVPLDGDDVLRMDFSRPSWVEVYDRDGHRLYYSLAKEGSEVLLRGAGPMRVLLGDVEGAEIVYNGEPFDLDSFEARKVARFVVGEGTPAPARRPEPASPSQAEEDAAATPARPAVAEALDADAATADNPEPPATR